MRPTYSNNKRDLSRGSVVYNLLCWRSPFRIPKWWCYTQRLYSKEQKLLSEAFSICLKAMYWSTSTSIWVPSYHLVLILLREIIKFKKSVFSTHPLIFYKRALAKQIRHLSSIYNGLQDIWHSPMTPFWMLFDGTRDMKCDSCDCVGFSKWFFSWSFGEKVSITLSVRNLSIWQPALKFYTILVMVGQQ